MQVKRAELKKAVQILRRVRNGTAIPILDHVYVEAGENKVTLTVNNLQESLKVTLHAECEKAESFLVPLESLTEVSKLKTEYVAITVVGTEHKSEDFPLPVKTAKTSERTINLDTFLSLFRDVSKVVSTDETRWVMQGVYWDSEESALIATDGRRLMCAPLSHKLTKDSCIIPVTKTLLHTPLGEKAVVSKSKRKNILQIKTEQIQYQVNLIEGKFPNYKQVIPADVMLQISFELSVEDVNTILKLTRGMQASQASLCFVLDETMVSVERMYNGHTEGSPLRLNATTQGVKDEKRVIYNPDFIAVMLRVGLNRLRIDTGSHPGPTFFENETDTFGLVMPKGK